MAHQHPLLVRAAQEGTPIIDGDQVTFLWKGKSAPYLYGDFTGWQEGQALRFSRLAPGLWSHSLTLPVDAYLEYAIFADPGAPRIWMNVGNYDLNFLPESNRRMAALLKERGFEVHFEEYPAGHNYTAWRDELGKGFETLYGR